MNLDEKRARFLDAAKQLFASLKYLLEEDRRNPEIKEERITRFQRAIRKGTRHCYCTFFTFTSGGESFNAKIGKTWTEASWNYHLKVQDKKRYQQKSGRQKSQEKEMRNSGKYN